MGRKLNQSGHHASIYFQLFDEQKWEMIDKLMTLPKYEKSRTSLINKALDYGLPKLIEEEFGEITYNNESNENKGVRRPQLPVVVETISDEMIDEMIRLLKEIALYGFLTKSMCCSLFNTMSRDFRTKMSNPEAFDKGKLDSTPDYLEDEELDRLKNMRGDDG